MSFAEPKPDFAGFAKAQATLRRDFGKDICFYGPASIIYDPSLPPSAFDDEGIPLDPLALASGVAVAQVEIPGLTVVGYARCQVVFRALPPPVLRRDETFEQAIGIRSGMNRDLILDPADASAIAGASHFQVGELVRDSAGNVVKPEQFAADETELWKIVNGKLDHFGQVKRYIVYGQGTR